ncbi:MAG: hypothetical protein Q9163_000983 [Psora crenata]
MAASQLLAVQTASSKNSIWREVNLVYFRRNVALLKQATEVVRDKEVYGRRSTDDVRYTLPFDTEKIFVNHLAFIAAIEKAAARVTAVSLEEGLDSVTQLQRLHFASPTLLASSEIRDHIFSLSTLYESVNDCEAGSEHELEILHSIARQSYAFCADYGSKPEMRDVMHNKYLQQVNKLGRYWGLCGHITEISRKHRKLFRRIQMISLTPYEATFLPSLPGMPSIKCHVHAEIQLLTFYAFSPDLYLKAPRALGVSRAACYLCDLFIRQHGEFSISRTHGRLYDQWTVPDIFNYQHLQPQRQKFRRVLREVNKELLRVLPIEEQRARSRIPARPFPNESDATLPTRLPRLGTLLSNGNSSTVSTSTDTIPLCLPTMPMPPAEEEPTEASPGPDQQQDENFSREPALQESQKPGPLTIPPLRPQEPFAMEIRHEITPTISHASSPTAPSLSPRAESLTTSPLPPTTFLPPSPAHKPASTPASTTAATISSSSLTTIDSWEYPILAHALKPGHAIRTRTKKLDIIIEIEHPAQGTVQVTNQPRITQACVKHTVDVGAMQPGGPPKWFQRDDGGDNDHGEKKGLVLNLQNGEEGCMTQLTLEWK